MKFTTVASLFLAATTAIAVPTTKRSQTLQIKDFAATLAEHVAMGTLELVVWDPSRPMTNDTNPSICQVNWNTDRQFSPDNLVPCQGGYYQLGFPNGLGKNIESFMLEVAGGPEPGFVALDASAANSNWVCDKNPTTEIKERCALQGVLDVSVSPV